MRSRRILVTGLSSYWGGRLAQSLERDPAVETIVGVDTEDPTRELDRTEFVRIGTQHALIRRIVQAAEIDTVIDTRLIVDSLDTSPRRMHENNVIGTMNILAACSGPESPVKTFVFKSSAHYYGAQQDDPAFFAEGTSRPHEPTTPIERDIVDAERSVRDFGRRNEDKTVAVLRFANGVGPGLRTSHMRLFAHPVVPTVLGFDPRYQFIHEEDIVGCLEHAMRHDLDGVYNCAADGVLALSEVLALLGKRSLPILPPFGTALAAGQLRRLGLRLPPEMLNQLRYGRGLDNRRFKATGYAYRYTTREAVIKLTEHLRVSPLLEEGSQPYRYEAAVEDFVRRSPSVRRAPSDWPPSAEQVAMMRRLLDSLEAQGATEPGDDGGDDAGPAPRATPGGYDDLDAEEVIALLPSLGRGDLEELRRHEAAHGLRPEVLEAIEGMLEGATAPPPRE